MEDDLNVIYDATTDVLRVNGMSYSGHIFRMLALADPGTWLRIEGRDNGVISVFTPRDDTGRIFDMMVGKGPVCGH